MTLYELPASYDPDNTKSVDIPRALIPIIAGLLQKLEYSNVWTEDDQVAGPQAIYLLQERLIPAPLPPPLPGYPPDYMEMQDNWWEGADSTSVFADQAGTIPATVGGPIRCWKSKSGTALICPTATPTIWTGSAVQFTGVQYLDTTSIQRKEPETILVDMHLSGSGSRTVYDTNNFNGARLLTSSTTGFYMYANAANILGFATNQRVCHCAVWNGALSINRANAMEQNASLGLISGSGFRIGATGGGAAQLVIGDIFNVYHAPRSFSLNQRIANESFFR